MNLLVGCDFSGPITFQNLIFDSANSDFTVRVCHNAYRILSELGTFTYRRLVYLLGRCLYMSCVSLELESQGLLSCKWRCQCRAPRLFCSLHLSISHHGLGTALKLCGFSHDRWQSTRICLVWVGKSFAFPIHLYIWSMTGRKDWDQGRFSSHHSEYRMPSLLNSYAGAIGKHALLDQDRKGYLIRHDRKVTYHGRAVFSSSHPW